MASKKIATTPKVRRGAKPIQGKAIKIPGDVFVKALAKAMKG